MKSKRELAIAMVLVGLVSVNLFYLLDIFFTGLYRAMFRFESQILIGGFSAALVILGNVVALVGVFYLVRPQKGESTQGVSAQGASREGVSTPVGPAESGPAESGPAQGGPTEGAPAPGGPPASGPPEQQDN